MRAQVWMVPIREDRETRGKGNELCRRRRLCRRREAGGERERERELRAERRVGLGYKTRRIRSSFSSSYSPARRPRFRRSLSITPSVRLSAVLKYVVFDLLLAVRPDEALSLSLLLRTIEGATLKAQDRSLVYMPVSFICHK